MTRQIEIQEKQSQENDKVAKNNKFLGWIIGIATVAQAVIAYCDYTKTTIVNPPIAMDQSQKISKWTPEDKQEILRVCKQCGIEEVDVKFDV